MKIKCITIFSAFFRAALLGLAGFTGLYSPLLWAGSLQDITQVAASWSHTCALTTGGTVRCWGAN
ncbi:MAG: hypothetical protein GY832_10560 [Chloroflexi bacterium]|nr:hypothetical protein [Chloroflexota bacterium]